MVLIGRSLKKITFLRGNLQDFSQVMASAAPPRPGLWSTGVRQSACQKDGVEWLDNVHDLPSGASVEDGDGTFDKKPAVP
jgi:hypothetical protein